MGAGSYIVGTLIDWMGYSFTLSKEAILLGLPLNLSKAAFFWGPILVLIGAPLLIFDLGRKERFLYTCLKPDTSWIARGSIIISGFILVGGAFIGMYIWPFHWLEGTPTFRVVLQIVGFLFAFGTAFYTGMLLKSVESVPLWDTPLLPGLFVLTSLSTGSMGIILFTLALRPGGFPLLDTLIAIGQGFILVEGAVLALYIFLRSRAKSQGESSVSILISGDLRLVFWGGIVLLGFVFPALLYYLYAQFPDRPILLFATGFFLLAGRLFLRFGIVTAGIKDQPPFEKLIEIESP
jgi:formate-dependent nitrite reductase membrane component NrfD